MAEREFDPCLWSDPTGTLWLFWSQCNDGKHFDGRAGVWETHTANPDAENPAWSAPRRIANGIMMNKPTVLSSGRWLLPTTVWSGVGREWHRELDPERFSNVLAGDDQVVAYRRDAEIAFELHCVVDAAARRRGDLDDDQRVGDLDGLGRQTRPATQLRVRLVDRRGVDPDRKPIGQGFAR